MNIPGILARCNSIEDLPMYKTPFLFDDDLKYLILSNLCVLEFKWVMFPMSATESH